MAKRDESDENRNRIRGHLATGVLRCVLRCAGREAQVVVSDTPTSKAEEIHGGALR
jgi:hypothetical protein